ncbi:HD-GYP domain-containing protein [Bacillus sp. RAR_GA_16]|uniref:HD-GYP domain-containing protein n=1 Tax=Bacillus sp. RAR_GA_16 TaxID=2876774 RepID=UPI001CCF9882|nr:HD domain-containing phosphohydrolase [Bacillus sp. RAR_GA_16]MCA0173998.1 HD domain-containing protein [Bacillus sp. RAR_GA_16]
MQKCTLLGHAHLFSNPSLQLMELLRRHDAESYHHSVQSTSYFIDFCLHAQLHSFLQPIILQSILLHDIGKLLVPAELLQKSGPLTFAEKTEIEQHPELGLDLLSDYQEIEFEPALILYHHGNADGSGYPYHLRSEQLPFAVKLLRVIDSYTAMTTERTFRPKRTSRKAIIELQKHVGTTFDAYCTSLFAAYLDKRLNGKKILLHYLDYASYQK